MSEKKQNKIFKTINSVFTIAAMAIYIIMPILTLAPSIANADEDDVPNSITIPSDIATNPSLNGACGLNIALVLDDSASIGGNLSTMKTDFITFINNLLPSTPTEFSVTYFNTTATVVQSFTSTLTSVTTAVNGVPSANNYTNWQQGLTKAQSTFPGAQGKPNLIIFASDGLPNRYNSPAQGSGSNIDQTAFNAAVTQANAIKNSGTRIVTLGIGNVYTPSMIAISSSDAYYSASNYSQLLTTLNQIATDLCGSSVTECKPGDQPKPGCSTGQPGICATGTQACSSSGKLEECLAPTPVAINCTNGLDNDCNGTVDSKEAQCSSTPTPSPTCGDGVIQTGEQCDNGSFNDASCSAPYGGSCPYCSATCQNVTVTGNYCGDGTCDVNTENCSSCSQDCNSCGSGGGGGYSGGGGGGATVLAITNEKTESFTGTQANVSWFTNLPANTRVVYDIISHSTIGTAPNYGYAHSTVQDSSQITFHAVTLTGLTPGVTYYWKAVSSQGGAPYTLGTELSFVFPKVAGATTENPAQTPTLAVAPPAPTQGTGNHGTGNRGEVAGAVAEAPQQTINPQTNATQTGNNNNAFLASIGPFLKNLLGINCAQVNNCCWKFALILTILGGIYLFFREGDQSKKKKLGTYKKLYTDLLVALAAITILIVWLKCWWIIAPEALFILWIAKEKFMQK